MTPYDAANKAFKNCRSRSKSKNEAVAPFLAKQYMIAAGVKGQDLEAACEHSSRLLDEWYGRKAANDSFFPQPEDYAETETNNIDGIDTINPETT